MSQTELKVRWKKWGHLSSFHVSFLNYGSEIAKILHYIYALSENGMLYRCLSKCSWDIEGKHQKKADSAEI